MDKSLLETTTNTHKHKQLVTSCVRLSQWMVYLENSNKWATFCLLWNKSPSTEYIVGIFSLQYGQLCRPMMMYIHVVCLDVNWIVHRKCRESMKALRIFIGQSQSTFQWCRIRWLSNPKCGTEQQKPIIKSEHAYIYHAGFLNKAAHFIYTVILYCIRQYWMERKRTHSIQEDDNMTLPCITRGFMSFLRPKTKRQKTHNPKRNSWTLFAVSLHFRWMLS